MQRHKNSEQRVMGSSTATCRVHEYQHLRNYGLIDHVSILATQINFKPFRD